MRSINIAILCFTTIAVGCQNSSRQHPSEDLQAKPETASNVDRSNAEMEILVIVLRWQLETAEPDQVCFLATSRSDDRWIDPPNVVMDALSNLRLELKPVSKARLPKNGEMDPKFSDSTFQGMDSEERFRGVEDPSTGRGSVVYYASVTKWINSNTAEVSHEIYWGPDAGGGGKLVVQLKDGKWTIKELYDGWMS